MHCNQKSFYIRCGREPYLAPAVPVMCTNRATHRILACFIVSRRAWPLFFFRKNLSHHAPGTAAPHLFNGIQFHGQDLAEPLQALELR